MILNTILMSQLCFMINKDIYKWEFATHHRWNHQNNRMVSFPHRLNLQHNSCYIDSRFAVTWFRCWMDQLTAWMVLLTHRTRLPTSLKPYLKEQYSWKSKKAINSSQMFRNFLMRALLTLSKNSSYIIMEYWKK